MGYLSSVCSNTLDTPDINLGITASLILVLSCDAIPIPSNIFLKTHTVVSAAHDSAAFHFFPMNNQRAIAI